MQASANSLVFNGLARIVRLDSDFSTLVSALIIDL